MPRFTRRMFCAALAIAAVPVRVVAQATPESSPEIDFLHLDGLENASGRTFTLIDPGFSDSIIGSLVSLEAGSFQFDRRSQARSALYELPDMLEEYYRAVILNDEAYRIASFRSGDVSAPELGDRNIARSIVVLVNQEPEWSFGISLVLDDHFIQILIGQSRQGAITPTIDVAEASKNHWPGDSIRDVLPELNDVPEGMAESED